MSNILRQEDLTATQIRSLAERLKQGKTGVFLSDTIYGIFTTALDEKAVENLYRIRKRNFSKPMIVLLPDISLLGNFGINPDPKTVRYLNSVWPGPVSVVLDCPGDKFKYLHRGTNSLAFRIPDNDFLLEILKSSGPLTAPSANPEGETPARNIIRAEQYFGKAVDFYIDGGEANSPGASTVIRISAGNIRILRQGVKEIAEGNL